MLRRPEGPGEARSPSITGAKASPPRPHWTSSALPGRTRGRKCPHARDGATEGVSMRWRFHAIEFPRGPLAVVLVMAAGLILTAVAFITLRRAEERRVEADFARRSTAQAIALQHV